MAGLITPGPDYDAALWGAAAGIRRERQFLGVTAAGGVLLAGQLCRTTAMAAVAR